MNSGMLVAHRWRAGNTHTACCFNSLPAYDLHLCLSSNCWGQLPPRRGLSVMTLSNTRSHGPVDLPPMDVWAFCYDIVTCSFPGIWGPVLNCCAALYVCRSHTHAGLLPHRCHDLVWHGWRCVCCSSIAPLRHDKDAHAGEARGWPGQFTG